MTLNLFGSKAILGFLLSEYGIRLTRMSLYRKSALKRDPFPLSDRIVGRKPRIVANVVRVRAWMRRNYPEAQSSKEPAAQRNKMHADGPQLP